MLIGDQSLIKEYDKRSIVPRSIANGDTSSALFFEARQTQYAHNPSHNSKLFLETGFKYKYVHRTLRRPYLPALSSRCSCRPGGVSNCCPSTTVAAKDRNGPRGRLREIIYGRVRLRARGSRPFKQNNHTSRRRRSSHGKVSKAPSLSAAWNTRTGVGLEAITECGWLNDLERPL